MLDREVVGEFLDYKFENSKIKIPKNVSKRALIEMFCEYVEDDLGEWLNDNYKSFFDYGVPDWNRIRGRIKHYQS